MTTAFCPMPAHGGQTLRMRPCFRWSKGSSDGESLRPPEAGVAGSNPAVGAPSSSVRLGFWPGQTDLLLVMVGSATSG